MMRRSGPGGGGGAGGFSKPPPAPLTHGGSGRVRLHTPEVNGSHGKDRFGSPRERSPSLVSSLPLSPSHPGSREKSPNPASQDLHDCSMCLSAYIQSLNTVCGTACRLSQCLAQVSAESGCFDFYGNGGPGVTNPVREAADAWEGVARAVGVASAAVKTQMLVLLQEVQSRQDISDTVRRQEINRVTQAMLSAFLGLQYQFSAIFIERFTNILQNLRDDCMCASSQVSAGLQVSKSSHPPMTDISQLPVSSQYNVQLTPQQTSWPPAQQQQPVMKGVQTVPLLESPGKEDKPRSRHTSGGHSRHTPTAPGWSNPGSSAGCPNNTSFSSGSNYGSSLSLSMTSGNTLSPGSCYGPFSQLNNQGSGWHNDAISRRWSMGGPSTDGWERNSSLGPFSLIANRRWSVPEASEHDASAMSDVDSVNDFYGSCGFQGDWNGTIGGSAMSWGSRGGLHVPSRDSSVTRSPSHSRSVTPDPSRQTAFISSEELQEVIDLLSLPLSPEMTLDAGEVGGGVSSGGGGGTVGGNSSGCGGGGSSTRGTSPVAVSPTNLPITQVLEEVSKQQQIVPQQQHQIPSQSCPPLQTSKHQQISVPPPPPPPPPPPHQQQQQTNQLQHQQQQQQKQQHQQPQQQQQQQQQPKEQQRQQEPILFKQKDQEPQVVVDARETNRPVSTPIWPPSGIAPGVTLTECSSAEEKPTLPLWTDGIGFERRSHTSHNRDAPNRASWPAASTLLWAGLDGFVSEREGEDGGSMSPIGLPQYRRHSTDTTHLNLGLTSSLTAKTRSSDNITGGSDGVKSSADSKLQQLLLLNSILPASSPPTPTSQYSLFTHTS